MAKDAYYFPHDCHAQDDEKILDIRASFGWEGYGLYWAIIERMRAAKDYKLSCDKMKSLAMVLGMDYSRFMKFMALCFKVKLFVKHNKMYHSESLFRRMVKVDAKRDQARKAAQSRWNKEPLNDADALQPHIRTHSGRNATGNANKRKVNKTKEKETIITFKKWFELYDLNQDEIKCEFEWTKLTPTDKKIIAIHLPEYIEVTEKKFRPKPLSYLKDRKFMNEIIDRRKQSEIPADPDRPYNPHS